MVKLAGKRVLVVEDEPILAMSIEDMLTDIGCIVVGPALSAEDAQLIGQEATLDAAMLDINMGEGESFHVARILREREVPFCFATGYGATGVPTEFRSVPVLPKPFTAISLGAMLHTLMR